MPTVSEKQEHFMQAIKHNPAFARKVGVPQKVGKEFTKDFKDSLAEIKQKLMEFKGEPLEAVATPVEKSDSIQSETPETQEVPEEQAMPIDKDAGAMGRA